MKKPHSGVAKKDYARIYSKGYRAAEKKKSLFADNVRDELRRTVKYFQDELVKTQNQNTEARNLCLRFLLSVDLDVGLNEVARQNIKNAWRNCISALRGELK